MAVILRSHPYWWTGSTLHKHRQCGGPVHEACWKRLGAPAGVAATKSAGRVGVSAKCIACGRPLFSAKDKPVKKKAAPKTREEVILLPNKRAADQYVAELEKGGVRSTTLPPDQPGLPFAVSVER